MRIGMRSSKSAARRQVKELDLPLSPGEVGVSLRATGEGAGIALNACALTRAGGATSPGGRGSSQQRRENQMLEPLERNRIALNLRLKYRALQGRNQEARQLITLSLPRQLAKLHRRFQAIRDRLAHLLIYFNQPLPDHFAVAARFGAEVADQTSVLPTDPIEIFDLRIDVGA